MQSDADDAISTADTDADADATLREENISPEAALRGATPCLCRSLSTQTLPPPMLIRMQTFLLQCLLHGDGRDDDKSS